MLQPHTVGLLLAAGFGRRFDPTGTQNKLTQSLSNGIPVAVQTAQNLRGAVQKIIAVAQSKKLAQQLTDAGCEVHLFAQAEQGMGASLAFAMKCAIKLSTDINSVLVALADMPYVQADTNRKIVEVLNDGADIAQPIFQQQVGHPVGFSKRHFPALMALSGDNGARHLLREFPVDHIEVDDAGILRDVDTLSDLS